jgi:hypothetical protein
MKNAASVRKNRAGRAEYRLLMICPYPVLPASSGGKIRILRLARELSDLGADVTLLTPYKPGQRLHAPDHSSVRLLEVRYPFLFPLLLTDRPFPYGYLVSFHPGYALSLLRLLSSFDLIQFEHVAFADLLDKVSSTCPVVYDAHNVEYDYQRSECANPVIREIIGRRMYHLERKLVDRADRTLVCSELDRNRFNTLYQAPVDKTPIIPNGIQDVRPGLSNAAAFLNSFPALRRFPLRAVFSGSDVHHNRAAVRFIVEQLAPLLGGECSFTIHGSCGRSFVRTQQDNVFFDPAGDFGCYAHSGSIGLNPVTCGSGTNLKLINYLAHGLPVVSTRFGVRGYEGLESYVVVRPLADFAAALRSHPTLASGVPMALMPYLWRAIAGNLNQIHLSLLVNPLYG